MPLSFAVPSKPVQAALYMTGACVVWSFFSAIVRDLSDDLHGFELAFFRVLFGTLAILPFLFRHGLPAPPRRAVLMFYMTRGVIGAISLLGWFYALTIVPLADVTALSFTTPLFATVAAIFVLHEVVRLRRWTATIVGFIGAMAVVRPGFETVNLGMLAAVVASAAAAANLIYMKLLSRTEPSHHIVAYQTLFLIPFALAAALPVWRWPAPEDYLWMALLGAGGSFANWLTVKAFAIGETTAVLPFDFLRLPFVAIIAFVAFAEVPGVWTWIGGSIIFASSVYIARREAQLARRDARRDAERDVATTTKVV